jgi:hypothetical protein
MHDKILYEVFTKDFHLKYFIFWSFAGSLAMRSPADGAKPWPGRGKPRCTRHPRPADP